jgi:hypothetical protein
MRKIKKIKMSVPGIFIQSDSSHLSPTEVATEHDSWEKLDATALFEQAAANQGFTNFKEFAAVSAMTSNESVQSAAADSMDDPASAPLVPKPEFKAQFEAWQRNRGASSSPTS